MASSASHRLLPLVGLCFGLSGVIAWAELLPYSPLTSQLWGFALSAAILGALVLTVSASTAILICSLWPGAVAALSRRVWPPNAIILICGLVFVALLGIAVWWGWTLTVGLCISTMPIAPGACPPVPSVSEEVGVLVGFLVSVLVPCGLLVLSMRLPRHALELPAAEQGSDEKMKAVTGP